MEQTERYRRPSIGDSAGLTVAAALRAELARRSLSATELTARLEDIDGNTPDPRYVRRRLAGQTPLSLDDVQWFASALGVPMRDLLGGLS